MRIYDSAGFCLTKNKSAPQLLQKLTVPSLSVKQFGQVILLVILVSCSIDVEETFSETSLPSFFIFLLDTKAMITPIKYTSKASLNKKKPKSTHVSIGSATPDSHIKKNTNPAKPIPVPNAIINLPTLRTRIKTSDAPIITDIPPPDMISRKI